jgi:hypothetical protein
MSSREIFLFSTYLLFAFFHQLSQPTATFITPTVKHTLIMPSEIPTSEEHRRAPQAVCITSLNQALAPFYDSFWGTKIVTTCFTTMLHVVHRNSITSPSSDKETRIARHWQGLQEDLRNPRCRLYKDPESLQVAQVPARVNALEVAQELVSKSRYMNGDTWDPWNIEGDEYSTVSRGQKWVYTCARRFLPEHLSLSEKTSVLQNLRFLDAPQPQYQSFDTRYVIEKNTKIFGKDGLIRPALGRFIANNRIDIGIQFLTDVVIRQAMNVADVLQVCYLEPADSEYIWYISGLVQAREKFISTFEQPCSLSNGKEVSRAMRGAIMDLSFVELWNVLWKRARQVRDLNTVHSKLKEWILRSFARVRPDSNREYITSIEKAHAKFRRSAFPTEIDVNAIRNYTIYNRHDMLLLGPHWARHLYPEHSANTAKLIRQLNSQPEDIQTIENEDTIPDVLSRNTYDLSHLEPHGPCIDPKNYSEAVLDPPTGQNCTICAEEYTQLSAEGSQVGDGCVRLPACGHYFHYECIGAWMNGVSANTNTCPECRTMICEERREVRAKEV